MSNLSGGHALMAKLQEIMKKVEKSTEVKVGFLEGAQYPDGTSVPMVAAIQEYGTSTIPSRPFFRTMVAEKSPGWGDALAAIAKRNNYDMGKSMAEMGELIGGQLGQSIIDTNAPPLAKETILARASGSKRGRIKSPTIGKPLIDTGNMLNSIGYQVDDGEERKVRQSAAIKGPK